MGSASQKPKECNNLKQMDRSGPNKISNVSGENNIVALDLNQSETSASRKPETEHFFWSMDSMNSLLQSLQLHLQKLPKEARNVIAGGIAGILAKSVVAPLDRIKILYQVSSAQFRLLDIPKVAQNIIREEGLSALWKGNMATMIRVFPYAGIQFMVFDFCKQTFLQRRTETNSISLHSDDAPEPINIHDRKWGMTPMESLVSGMVAGIISVVCTYPLDLARAQLAVLKKPSSHNHGFASILKENYNRAGAKGLFRGISPTLLGILPYSGIAFALNEQAKLEVSQFMIKQR